jgi:hypothetical protein
VPVEIPDLRRRMASARGDIPSHPMPQITNRVVVLIVVAVIVTVIQSIFAEKSCSGEWFRAFRTIQSEYGSLGFRSS